MLMARLLLLLLLLPSLQAAAGCTAFFTYSVSGDTIYADGTSSTGNITVWKWYVNGMLATSGSPQAILPTGGPGTYKVCLVVKTADGCSDDCCAYITVGSGGSGCEAVIKYETEGLQVWLDGSYSSGNITGWQWFVNGVLFDDSGPFTDYTATDPGTYEFCLVVWNNDCCDTTCKVLTLEDNGGDKPCEAVIKYETEGLQVWLNGSYSSGNITGWQWFVNGVLFDDSGPFTDYTATDPGTYEFCLVVWNNDCCDTTCKVLTLEDNGGDKPCEAVIKYETNGLQVWLNGSYSSGNITGWQWFVNGVLFDDSGPFTDYTVTDPGTYEFCLVVWNNDCCDTTCKVLTLENNGSDKPCEAVIKYETDGLNIHVDGSYSSGSVTQWQWWVNGMLVSNQGPTEILSMPQSGTYEICLVIVTDDNCSDTVCKQITVAQLTGDFSMKPYYESGKLWLHVVMPAAGKMNISLYSAMQFKFLEQSVSLPAGLSLIPVADVHLPSGLVMVVAEAPEFSQHMHHAKAVVLKP